MSKNKILKMIVVIIMTAIFGITENDTIVSDTVTAVQAAQTVKINKKKVVLIKGETTRLKLRNVKGKIQWKSRKKSIASVNKNGVVKAKKKGKTSIYAKYNKKTYVCTVQVEMPRLNKTSITLHIGEMQTLNLKGTKQKVIWSTEEPEIVKVNKKGIVTALQEGTAVITAKVGKKCYSCTVIVKAQDMPVNLPSETIVPEDNVPENIPTDVVVPINIEMAVPRGKISTEDKWIPITIWNNTDVQISIPEVYKLEQKVDKQWKNVPIKEEWKWENAAVLNGGETVTLQCDFYALDNEMYGYYYIPGEYRVTKIVYVGEIQKELVAEFTIEQAVLNVTMEIIGENTIPVSESYIPIVIKNLADNSILIDNAYEFYRKESNEWIPVPLDYDFTSEMLELEANGTMEFNCGFTNSEGEYICPSGEYKITRYVAIRGQSEILSVEFTIIE